jgi:uncharacterized protein YecE (DUF72 family)
MAIRIGTAGWTIPRQNGAEFPPEGSSLERYATRFSVAEINSSFHRPHRTSTWQRWRDSVPAGFQFSVKLPKTITHQAKLEGCSDLVVDFLAQAHVLGNKLAVLLVQLPPKLEFDPAVARPFFSELGARSGAKLVCEPRNASWFTKEGAEFLAEWMVARVAADPAKVPAAALPGGWHGLRYWRLHGSPVVYRSSYAARIKDYAELLTRSDAAGAETWCIFDNTASSAALSDALALDEAVTSRTSVPE